MRITGAFLVGLVLDVGAVEAIGLSFFAMLRSWVVFVFLFVFFFWLKCSHLTHIRSFNGGLTEMWNKML